MNPNDIPADKLDKLRTYYISTKKGFVGKDTTEEHLHFVTEGYNALPFDNADAAVKFAHNLVASMGIPLARVFYGTPQGLHGIALIRKVYEDKLNHSYIGQSDIPMPLQGGLPALLNRIKQSRR